MTGPQARDTNSVPRNGEFRVIDTACNSETPDRLAPGRHTLQRPWFRPPIAPGVP